MVEKIKVKAIIAFTASGYTAKLLSKAKPSIPIFACCQSKRNCRRLKLYSDVYPIETKFNEEITPETLKTFNSMLMEKNGLKKGDTVLFTGAMPDLMTGKTNFIKIHELGSLS